MSLTDQLLAAISTYGLPAFFAVIAIAAVGVPLPVTFALIAAGSFVAIGEMSLWQVIVAGSLGAILGDQVGYFLGKSCGPGISGWLKRRKGGRRKIDRARAFTERWGALGIFFSRWLVTPLGPWINFTSGMTNYRWRRFFVWDVIGETLWVVLYVLLGKFFSGSVQALADVLGSLVWVLVGLIAAATLIWWIAKSFQSGDEGRATLAKRPT
jgi:membrane-associated protein